MTYIEMETAIHIACAAGIVAFVTGLLLGIRCRTCRRLRGKKPPKARRHDLFD